MNELDAASDQFSLAARSTKTLTGKPAFSGRHAGVHLHPSGCVQRDPRRFRRPPIALRGPRCKSRTGPREEPARREARLFPSAAEFPRCTRAGRRRRRRRTRGARTSPAPAADGEPTGLANRPINPTSGIDAAVGMAAVLRETIGGGSSTGATVAAAPRRWRVCWLGAVRRCARAGRGPAPRDRATPADDAMPAPASARRLAPSRALASTSESVPTTTDAVAAHALPRTGISGFSARAWEGTSTRSSPPYRQACGRPGGAESEEAHGAGRRSRIRPRVAC